MKFTVFDASATQTTIFRWANGFQAVQEFYNDCHDKAGRFCSSPGGKLLRTIRKEGGATLDYENNMSPIRSGYAVAARPAHAAVFNLDGAGRKQVDEWLVVNKELLSKRDFHVGAWHDKATGKVWLDITRVYPNTSHGRALALRTAGRHNQIAIFHLDKGEEIEKRNADEIRALTASADGDNAFDRYGNHHTSCGRWPHKDEEELYLPSQPRGKDGRWTQYGSGPFAPSARASSGYERLTGQPTGDLSKVTAPRAERVRAAALYKTMPMDDPKAHAAYRAMAAEVAAQYDYMTKTLGIRVQVTKEDPYPDVHSMVEDVQKNGRLKVMSTATTGGHPLFSDRENDMFRAVHDFFGHAATGRDFSRHGERAAFLAHAASFKSKDAIRALYTETEMQNAFLTVYGNGFGPQKIGLAPDSLVFRGLGLTASGITEFGSRQTARQAKRRQSPLSIRGRDPSLRWPHLYDILRSKGYSKEAAARISNSRRPLRKKGRIEGLPWQQADNPKALAGLRRR